MSVSRRELDPALKQELDNLLIKQTGSQLDTIATLFTPAVDTIQMSEFNFKGRSVFNRISRDAYWEKSDVSAGSWYYMGDVELSTGKYYVAKVYESANVSFINLINEGGTGEYWNLNSIPFLKIIPNASQLYKIRAITNSASTLTKLRVAVYEITASEYADASYTPPEWVSSDMSAGNFSLKGCGGKNLVNGLIAVQSVTWASGVGVKGTNTKIIPNNGGLISAEPNTTYTASVNTALKFAMNGFDENRVLTDEITWTPNAVTSYTFTTSAKTKYIFIAFKIDDTTVMNPENYQVMFCKGTDTTYEPYIPLDTYTIPYELHKVNGVVDEYKGKEGKMVQRNKKEILDGSKTWVYDGVVASGNGKRVYAIIEGLQNAKIDDAGTNSFPTVIKYNNKKLGNQYDVIDNAWIYTSNKGIYICIPNTDSGWGQNYTPLNTTTDPEINAQRNGWIMCDSSYWNTQIRAYNGDAGQTKGWIKRYISHSAGKHPNSLLGDVVIGSGVATCPTTVNDDPGWKPDRLYYNLATEIVTPVPRIQMPVTKDGQLWIEGKDSIWVRPTTNFEYSKNQQALNETLSKGVGSALAKAVSGNDVPMCDLWCSVTQTVGATGDVRFDTVLADTDNMFNLVNGKIVTFNTPGIYAISYSHAWDYNLTGTRELMFKVSDVLKKNIKTVAMDGWTWQVLDDIVRVKKGDWFTVSFSQQSGGSINIMSNSKNTPRLTITKVGD